MSIRKLGGGITAGVFIETEARPCSTYRATNPTVGDFVRSHLSGTTTNMVVNSMAAGTSLLANSLTYPYGVVTNVNGDSSVITVRWMNVKGIMQFQYSGTATVGKALQHVNTVRNNKVSCIATSATTQKPYVCAVDTPTSGYLQAFILG